MRTKVPEVEIEERVPGAGFVYLGDDDRIAWRDMGEHIEVNNHSNWTEYAPPTWQKAAAERLAEVFKKEVRCVRNLSR